MRTWASFKQNRNQPITSLVLLVRRLVSWSFEAKPTSMLAGWRAPVLDRLL